MNLSMTVRTAALRLPGHPAITMDGATLTYGALEDRVGRLARGLRDGLGLAAGSRIGLAMENCTDFFPILYGIWRAGLVAVPMNSKLHAKEMAFILGNSGCKLCFATPEIADRLADLKDRSLPPIEIAGTADCERLFRGDPVQAVTSRPEDEAWLF